jgi:hypothetical protein
MGGMAPATGEQGSATRDPALDELRARYRDGDLVLFVGAGVSAAAGLPSWAKLVEQLLARARARGADVSEVERLLAKDRYADALTAAADAVSEGDLIAVVKAALDDRTLAPEVPEIGRAIASLEPRLRAVLTTNLDHLLERAFQGRWPALHRATGSVGQDKGIILKLHGTLFDPRTWVLTRPQYDRAMYNDPLLADAVASVFRSRTLLFVGYGLADDDFDQVLGRVRALSGGSPPRHYALVLAAQVTPYWRKLREEAGVRIITYASHGDVPGMLRWLAEEGGAAASPPAGAGDVAMFRAPPVPEPSPPPPTSVRLPLPPDAPYDPDFYIHRPQEETRALAKLAVAGAPVVLWAPERFGKTTMLSHLLDRVMQEDAKLARETTVIEADLGAILPKQRTADTLLESFARHLLREVGAGPDTVDAIVRDRDGWSNKLRDLMEDHVLPRARGRLVLVLDKADALWGEADVQGDFYKALRLWKDRARKPLWSSLRLVLLISTTPALVFDDPKHQDSPFYNLTADFIELRELTPKQGVELAAKHGLSWSEDLVERVVYPALGGHPYLLRVLLYHLRLTGAEVAPLLAGDAALDLFDNHLAELSRLLRADDTIHKALCGLLGLCPATAPLDEDRFQRLRRAGVLARTSEGKIVIRSTLHERYLRRRWRAA